MRFLHGPGLATEGGKAVEATSEAGMLACPHLLHDGYALIAQRPPLSKRSVQHLEFLFHPAHATPADHPAAREYIQRGDGFGRDHGVTMRQDQHRRAQAYCTGAAGHEAEDTEWLEDRLFGV